MVLGGVTWFFGGSHGFLGEHMVFWGNSRRISHGKQSIKVGGEGGYRKFTALIR